MMTNDTAGLAEAALVWTFDLAPGQTFEQIVFIPFESLPSSAFRAMQPGKIGQPFERARNDWARLVSAWPTCQGPETAEALWLAARTAACHILINRDGAMLQPGPRRYTRSWIRDGVTMAAALLRLGEHQAVADFLDGFTPPSSLPDLCPVVSIGTGWTPWWNMTVMASGFICWLTMFASVWMTPDFSVIDPFCFGSRIICAT